MDNDGRVSCTRLCAAVPMLRLVGDLFRCIIFVQPTSFVCPSSGASINASLLAVNCFSLKATHPHLALVYPGKYRHVDFCKAHVRSSNANSCTGC